MTSALRSLFWVAIGALILLLPALCWGRPFIFYDTPGYWGWGRDILDAFQRPWPHAGQPWIDGRPLYGSELGAHGATSGDFRFMLTVMAARSPFYAVPLYLLMSTGGLWFVAAIQSLITAWALWVAVRVLAPGSSAVTYLIAVAALMVFSGVAFEAAYAMPDLFGGLGLLAAGVLIARPERIGWPTRLALCALMTYAALAHSSNVLDLAAAVAFGALVYRHLGFRAVAARIAPVVSVLVLSIVLAALCHATLASTFGRPLTAAPFPASRVLADGAGQRYLREVCAHEQLTSCDLRTVTADFPEYYLAIYPLEPPPAASDPVHAYDWMQHRVVTDAEASRRERFVAEQSRLVTGAIMSDGPHLFGAVLVRGAFEFTNFGINPDFDSLSGLLREGTHRRDLVIATVPSAIGCLHGAGRACGDFNIGPLALLQKLAVWASFAFIAAGLAGRMPAAGDLKPFLILMVFFVLGNALICGGVAGPFDRYQARVEWLIPFCAVLIAIHWARGRRRATDPATVPSSATPIVTQPTAASRP